MTIADYQSMTDEEKNNLFSQETIDIFDEIISRLQALENSWETKTESSCIALQRKKAKTLA